MSTADSSRALRPPSDRLLRTMAAVPVSSPVLLLGSPAGQHAHPLLRLGFPVHACDPRPAAVEASRHHVADLLGEKEAANCVRTAELPALDYPDDAFDWVIIYRAEVWGDDADTFRALLDEARRLLKPGGWCYVTVPAQPIDTEAETRSSGDGAPEPDPDDAPLFSMAHLEAQRAAVDLAEAEAPTLVREHDGPRVHAIYRRVERR